MSYQPDEECSRIISCIKKISQQKRLSVNMLAKEAEISSSALHELLNGKTKPQLYTLIKLCNALDIKISEFFDPEEETDQERQVVKLLRKFPCWKREMALEYLEMLAQYERADRKST